jgi:3-hydroxymyristoyl/3-hydroxydecanoyl-(acyl carrier protein) dehydratase
MRFLRPVLPGDQLRLHTRHVKTFGKTHWVQVEGRVNGEIVAHGELVLAS